MILIYFILHVAAVFLVGFGFITATIGETITASSNGSLLVVGVIMCLLGVGSEVLVWKLKKKENHIRNNESSK